MNDAKRINKQKKQIKLLIIVNMVFMMILAVGIIKSETMNIGFMGVKAANTTYDIDKPNTWPANTEIDFGNSVYGTRFTGTFTVAADTYKEVALKSGINFSTFTIIGYGGRVDSTNWAAPLGFAASKRYMWVFTRKSDNKLYLGTRSDEARSSAPYDIWVTYTK